MTFALHSENMIIASTLLLTNAPEGIAMQQFAQLFLVTGLGCFFFGWYEHSKDNDVMLIVTLDVCLEN